MDTDGFSLEEEQDSDIEEEEERQRNEEDPDSSEKQVICFLYFAIPSIFSPRFESKVTFEIYSEMTAVTSQMLQLS